MLVIMNNKLLFIPLVSLGAIVQLPQSAQAQAFSADSVKPSEPSEVSKMPNLSSVDQPIAVRSIAAPEVTNDRTNTLPIEVPPASTQVSAQVIPEPTIALMITPIVVAQPIEAQRVVVEPIESKSIEAQPIVAKPIVQTIAQASDPSAMTTTPILPSFMIRIRIFSMVKVNCGIVKGRTS